MDLTRAKEDMTQSQLLSELLNLAQDVADGRGDPEFAAELLSAENTTVPIVSVPRARVDEWVHSYVEVRDGDSNDAEHDLLYEIVSALNEQARVPVDL